MEHADRAQAIQRLLTDALKATQVRVEDESHKHVGHAGAASGAGHFKVTVVSPVFRECGLLARHRMIYDAVDNLMGRDIHALSIKARTPEEADEQDSP